MAKDGTVRGGARVGAGKKSKSLQEKIVDGQVADFKIEEDTFEEFNPLPPKEYLTAEQKDGSKLCTELIYFETYRWLKSVGCERIVTKQLVEDYALAKARHIQAEEILSKFGLLDKHPTTKAPIKSPYVGISIEYNKQATQIWCQIYAIVRENSAKGQIGSNDQSAKMEKILQRIK